MFRYDEVYNRLFDNKEFVEILCKFHSSNQTALDKKDKIKANLDTGSGAVVFEYPANVNEEESENHNKLIESFKNDSGKVEKVIEK